MNPEASGAGSSTHAAIWPWRSSRCPPTHNLSVLFALLPEDVLPPRDLAGIVGLTVYAVSARYPDEIDEATEAEHRQAVALARAAVRWAESTIAAG